MAACRCFSPSRAMWSALKRGATLRLRGLDAWLLGGQQEWELEYGRDGQNEGRIRVQHSLSPRQVDVLLRGRAVSPWMRRRLHGLAQKRTLDELTILPERLED